MAETEPSDQGRKTQKADEPQKPADESSGSPAEPKALSTADPAIQKFARDESTWTRDPESVGHLETSQVGEPSPLFVAGIKRVQEETAPEKAGAQHGLEHKRDQPDSSANRAANRDKSQEHQSREKSGSTAQLFTLKNLLIIGAVGIVCGVVGAIGYSYFAGSGSDKGSESSQGKGDSDKGGKSSEGSQKDSKTGAGAGTDVKSKAASASASSKPTSPILAREQESPGHASSSSRIDARARSVLPRSRLRKRGEPDRSERVACFDKTRASTGNHGSLVMSRAILPR